MNKTLKENMNAYYQAYHLPRRRLLQLQNIQQRSRPLSQILRLRKIWVPAAVAVVSAVAALLIFNLSSRPDKLKELISEIVYNHNKNLAVEIRSNSLNEVRNYLSELDFALIKSQRLSSDMWELVGGRYCSLLGHFAAQLKLRNKSTNNIYTYFQVGKLPAISEFSGFSEYYEKGVKVNLWTERGLVLALAGDSE